MPNVFPPTSDPLAAAVAARRATWAEAAELAALFVLGTLTAGYVAALIGFALGRPLQPALLAAAALGGAGVVAARASARLTAMLGLLAGVVAAAAGLALALAFADISYDGLYYHQGAVLELAEGWNPLHGGVIGRYHALTLWADHYPKAAWIDGAFAVQLTGRLDAGKWFNLPLVFAAAAAVAALLLRATRAPAWLVAAVAVAVAANPVALGQLISSYVDGPLGATLTVLAAAFGLLVWCGDRRAWWLIAASLWFAMNTKQSGVVYGAFLGAVALGVAWRRSGWRSAGRSGVMLLGLGLVGAGGLGYSPYVQNAVRHGHPFHPLLGPNKYDMVGPRRPPNLPALWPAAFFQAQLARTDPPQHEALAVEAKFPFTVQAVELTAWASTDPKSGGFGPLYGGLLLLGLAGGLAWAGRTRDPAMRFVGAAALVGIALTCSHFMCWWARYVPQGWWLAWIVPVAGLGVATRLGRGFVAVTAALGLLNAGLVLYGTLRYQGEQGRFLRDSIAAAAQIRAPLVLHAAELPILGAHLREAGVTFRRSDTPAPPGTSAHPLLRPSPVIAWWPEPR